jgi:hypothetical protein
MSKTNSIGARLARLELALEAIAPATLGIATMLRAARERFLAGQLLPARVLIVNSLDSWERQELTRRLNSARVQAGLAAAQEA